MIIFYMSGISSLRNNRQELSPLPSGKDFYCKLLKGIAAPVILIVGPIIALLGLVILFITHLVRSGLSQSLYEKKSKEKSAVIEKQVRGITLESIQHEIFQLANERKREKDQFKTDSQKWLKRLIPCWYGIEIIKSLFQECYRESFDDVRSELTSEGEGRPKRQVSSEIEKKDQLFTSNFDFSAQAAKGLKQLENSPLGMKISTTVLLTLKRSFSGDQALSTLQAASYKEAFCQLDRSLAMGASYGIVEAFANEIMMTLDLQQVAYRQLINFFSLEHYNVFNRSYIHDGEMKAQIVEAVLKAYKIVFEIIPAQIMIDRIKQAVQNLIQEILKGRGQAVQKALHNLTEVIEDIGDPEENVRDILSPQAQAILAKRFLVRSEEARRIDYVLYKARKVLLSRLVDIDLQKRKKAGIEALKIFESNLLKGMTDDEFMQAKANLLLSVIPVDEGTQSGKKF